MDPTLENLITLLADRTGIEPADIDPAATLESLGLDSLDLIELAIDLDDLFQVDLPEGEFRACRGIEDLHATILRHAA